MGINSTRRWFDLLLQGKDNSSLLHKEDKDSSLLQREVGASRLLRVHVDDIPVLRIERLCRVVGVDPPVVQQQPHRPGLQALLSVEGFHQLQVYVLWILLLHLVLGGFLRKSSNTWLFIFVIHCRSSLSVNDYFYLLKCYNQAV